jgi:transposase
MALRVRGLTEEERAELRRRAQSRTAPARVVERARLVLGVAGGETAPAVARRLGLGTGVVRQWLKRFNAAGLAGLEDRPRAGRPPTYTAEQVGQVLATAVTDPTTLGLPFGCWTLDRLQAYLNEERGLAIKRSRINEIPVAEGLRWRTDETRFGERVDPQFAEKRGPSSPSTRPHLQPA